MKFDFCPKCGAQVDRKLKKCPACGTTIRPFYKRPVFYICIVVLLFVFAGIANQNNDNTKKITQAPETAAEVPAETVEQETTSKPTPEPTKTPEQIADEYKSECEHVTYEELSRTPDQYKNKKIVFENCEIWMQVGNEKKSTYTMWTSKGSYGIPEDSISVEYIHKDGEPRFIEKDIVNVYGTFKGLSSISSDPEIKAEYIEMAE